MTRVLRRLAALVPLLFAACDSNPEAPRVTDPPQQSAAPEVKPSPATGPKGARPRAKGFEIPE